jgi:hypothetical protein
MEGAAAVSHVDEGSGSIATKAAAAVAAAAAAEGGRGSSMVNMEM